MLEKITLKDKEVEEIIDAELQRQQNYVVLIASENYATVDVLKASGSVLTNKYAEGYPSLRYYEGCEEVDRIESLAIERAKQIFQVNFVNVQPFSGTIANMAIYSALLKPGDKILGLDLKSGGHLSHGYAASGSGRIYQGYTYSVNEEGLLDYEEILEVARKVEPKIIVCGYSAFSRIVRFDKFHRIAKEVGAYLLADISHIAGLVVAGLHPSPSKFADVIMTTTHKTLGGPRGAIIMTNSPEIAKKIDVAVFPGLQGGAAFNIIAAKAIAFKEASTQEFKSYQEKIIENSKAFCLAFKNFGCKIISGETENHLFVIDVKTSYGLTGQQASIICKKINIVTNKNTIPFDSESPRVTSGLRLGVAAMTRRGFTTKEFENLARIIHEALTFPCDFKLQESLKKEVAQLLVSFPIYSLAKTQNSNLETVDDSILEKTEKPN